MLETTSPPIRSIAEFNPKLNVNQTAFTLLGGQFSPHPVKLLRAKTSRNCRAKLRSA